MWPGRVRAPCGLVEPRCGQEESEENMKGVNQADSPPTPSRIIRTGKASSVMEQLLEGYDCDICLSESPGQQQGWEFTLSLKIALIKKQPGAIHFRKRANCYFPLSLT